MVQSSFDRLNLITPTTWTVTNLTRYIRNLFVKDELLQDIWVFGEISNISLPSSGHLYFTLKDANAIIRCVMWRNTVQKQKLIPKDGDAIEVHGVIDVYEAGGQYQLYVDIIRPVGEGVLYQEFLRIKAQLEKEGLFDPTRKKPIPSWPKSIAIITSPTGAALRDILSTIKRRYPLSEIILVPITVQGTTAASGIVSALNLLETKYNPDVIILARGGGSLEDLWPFNDESVARAIAASSIPIITGIGHETDFTIADFVSDLRAPTPTAAALLATPDREELLVNISDLSQFLNTYIKSILQKKHQAIYATLDKLRFLSPLIQIRNEHQRLDELIQRLFITYRHQLELKQTHLEGLCQKLLTLNPISILSRGYAIVTSEEGRIIKKIAQVHASDKVQIRVSDGDFSAKVV